MIIEIHLFSLLRNQREERFDFLCLSIFEFVIIRCNIPLLHMYSNHYFKMFNKRKKHVNEVTFLKTNKFWAAL